MGHSSRRLRSVWRLSPLKGQQKKKGRSSNERPKSREETPKVGYGTSAQTNVPQG